MVYIGGEFRHGLYRARQVALSSISRRHEIDLKRAKLCITIWWEGLGLHQRVHSNYHAGQACAWVYTGFLPVKMVGLEGFEPPIKDL